MMMKRFGCICLVLCMVWSLVGCDEIDESMEEILLELEEEGVESLDELEVELEDPSEDDTEGDLGDREPFGTFTTVTTKGEEVTQDIFSQYDITMVNIWATWCPPCIEELDELQEVYAGLDENVNMISICHDAGTSLDLANEILESNGAQFYALVPNAELNENILNDLEYFPTTMFVDSNGNIVGDYLEGAPSVDVVETYNAMIEMYLIEAGF